MCFRQFGVEMKFGTLVLMNKKNAFAEYTLVLTITASVGSDKNILESLPAISSSEEPLTLDEPSIPENN